MLLKKVIRFQCLTCQMKAGVFFNKFSIILINNKTFFSNKQSLLSPGSKTGNYSFTKMRFTTKRALPSPFFFSFVSFILWRLFISARENPLNHVRTWSKRAKTEIIRIDAAPPGGQILQIFFAQKLYLEKLYQPLSLIHI